MRGLTADKLVRTLSWLIRLSIAVAIVSALVLGQWVTLFVSVLSFLLVMFLPILIERQYRIDLPLELEFIISVFIYAGLFLGEVHGYYLRFWWWDVVLHAASAIGFALAGFLILYALKESGKLDARPLTIVIFSFAFALSLGALWEIFEFAMDGFFGLNMQKSGLVDTMWDLIVDAAGALVVSFTGFLYLKGGKARVFRRAVERFVSHNPQMFERR